LASDRARSLLDDGGGLLLTDKYHTGKVRQDGFPRRIVLNGSVHLYEKK